MIKTNAQKSKPDLTESQAKVFLASFAAGCTAGVICKSLGVEIKNYLDHLKKDEEFRKKVDALPYKNNVESRHKIQENKPQSVRRLATQNVYQKEEKKRQAQQRRISQGVVWQQHGFKVR